MRRFEFIMWDCRRCSQRDIWIFGCETNMALFKFNSPLRTSPRVTKNVFCKVAVASLRAIVSVFCALFFVDYFVWYRKLINNLKTFLILILLILNNYHSVNFKYLFKLVIYLWSWSFSSLVHTSFRIIRQLLNTYFNPLV